MHLSKPEPFVALAQDDPDSRGKWYTVSWRAENGARGHFCWPEKRTRELYALLKAEFEGVRES